MPQINDAGLALIKSFEGCSLTAYWDKYGQVWTIGYGHTGDVVAGQVINQGQADRLLMEDLDSFELCVNNAVNRDLTPNQFAACVSLAYNIGCGEFQISFVLRCINAGDLVSAAQGFSHFETSGGVRLPGLVNRRNAEAKLFSTPE